MTKLTANVLCTEDMDHMISVRHVSKTRLFNSPVKNLYMKSTVTKWMKNNISDLRQLFFFLAHGAKGQLPMKKLECAFAMIDKDEK